MSADEMVDISTVPERETVSRETAGPRRAIPKGLVAGASADPEGQIYLEYLCV